ncbi:ribonuclease III [Candidatus Riesia pediculicola]|nr:ribonuclease III [Candidatus Riesia pediculicola]ARC53811.1 hypothetical protein AOE55_01440 [Candidatus Riesia pediculicola]QOJ86444.1 ribonuclease III [Candidatus Riesia pediculicola]
MKHKFDLFWKDKDIIMLQKNIGYRFNHLDFLYQSLTHRSTNLSHNERLEFLGDSILNLIISKFLYDEFLSKNEGEMSRTRSNLVKEGTLSDIANQLGIGSFINLGLGEIKNHGFLKRSILSNALEAIIGAIFLDSGSNIKTIENVIMNWYRNHADLINLSRDEKDPKTKLQEHLQKFHLPLPKYELLKSVGYDHEKQFTIVCKVFGFRKSDHFITIGTGKKYKEAEKLAAKHMFDKIVNYHF